MRKFLFIAILLLPSLASGYTLQVNKGSSCGGLVYTWFPSGYAINCGSTCSATVAINSWVVLSTQPDYGCYLSHWTNNGYCNTGDCYIFTNGNFTDSGGNYSVTANFDYLNFQELYDDLNYTSSGAVLAAGPYYLGPIVLDRDIEFTIQPSVNGTIIDGALTIASGTFIINGSDPLIIK